MTLADIYDEEFAGMLQLAKVLVARVPKRRDREICKKWISRLCNLESFDPAVKKNRNFFFRYMLNVVRRDLEEKTRTKQDFLQPDGQGPGKPQTGEKTFMSRWSPDRRTYVAAKPLPGRGALIYMAVAKDLSLGWEQPKNT